jgi:hypothetical protein
MAIENRNLEPGTRLVANYKKQPYVCTVEKEGDGLVYVLEDGSKHKSPSSAGMKVMGGKAVNGWKFWSLEGEEKPAPASEAPARTPKPKKVKKVIYKAPNQQGLGQGKTRFFCTACMKGFVHDGDSVPEVCPEDHRSDDPELTSSTEGLTE